MLSKKGKALLKYQCEDGDISKYSEVKSLIEELDDDFVDYTDSCNDYIVLTEEEADEKAKEYILDTVWAFNKDFLDCHSEAISEMDESVFSKIQEMCESANKTILRLIDDVDHFVNDAIMCDGRGHFLSPYDAEEHEVCVKGEYFFIYRIN